MQRKDLQAIQSPKSVLKVSFQASNPESKWSNSISTNSGKPVKLSKMAKVPDEGSSDRNTGEYGIHGRHEPEPVEPICEGGGGETEGEQVSHLSKAPGESEAPCPESGDGHDEFPDEDRDDEGEQHDNPAHDLVGQAEHEFGEGQPRRSVWSVERADGDLAAAHLAPGLAAGGEPSEEAVVVDEPDAAAAGAGAAQRAIRLGGEAADAALVPIFVIRAIRRGGERSLWRRDDGSHPRRSFPWSLV